MVLCPRCAAAVPLDQSFCGRCGTHVRPAATTVTVGTTAAAARMAVADEGAFAPGTVIAGRYRIAGLLGSGGMGQVYKATDLLVRQTVALKFLNEWRGATESMLERFRGEVRLARQVSHPNVCRIYDLGEADGRTFLTMEYIDGENLGSLLRRIGHLPEAKAVDIARQICAGLAAAHDAGVLHRDLKPGNIMIDAAGQARITDFGLATSLVDVAEDIRSGTPDYMAPEQLAGQEVTVRSDIYALGLVLHQMVTGRLPLNPQEVAIENPALAQLVTACLQSEPALRPPAALAVAARLPGGDPFRAILAAGGTPSPEMVAAAGGSETIGVRTALSCVAASAALLLLIAALADRTTLLALAGMRLGPAVMEQRCREMLARFGVPLAGTDHAGDFGYNQFLVDRLPVAASEAMQRITGFPAPVHYWYRVRPERLKPAFGSPWVAESDPPVTVRGEALIRMDSEGRLLFLQSVPSNEQPARPAAWPLVFSATGLNEAQFDATEPIWLPDSPFNERRAWLERGSEEPVRVEAAWWRGQPVYVRVSRERRTLAHARWLHAGQIYWLVLTVVMTLATAAMAIRNVRMRRTDRRSALRFGIAVTLAYAVAAFLAVSHAWNGAEFQLFQHTAALSLYIGLLAAATYLALEPLLRRHWPASLIAWTRLTGGAWRDPLVGRHLLYGIAVGCVLAGVLTLHDVWLGPGGPGARNEVPPLAASPARVAAGLLLQTISAAAGACWLVFLAVVLTIALRRRWAGIVAAALVLAPFFASWSPEPLISYVTFAAVLVGALSLLMRVGLLASMAAIWVCYVVGMFPLTLDTSLWYFGTSALALATVLGVSAAGAWFATRNNWPSSAARL